VNKVLLYIPDISTSSKRKKILSAHIQLPAYLINNLDKRYETKLLTSILKEGSSVPELIDFKKIVFMNDGVIRKSKDLNSSPNNNYKIFLILKFIVNIRSYILKNNISIFHSFGSTKVLFLSFIVKLITPKPLKVYHNIDIDIISINKYPYKLLFNRIDQIITSTNYSFDKISQLCNNVNLIKHGIINKVKDKKLKKNRVLFWRDPTYENGADITEKLFIDLSQKYSNIKFTIAVRPHSENIFNLEKIKNFNIDYMEYPYKNNLSIDKLIGQSICVILPFRTLSTHPQMAIVESMYSGTCVVSSKIESNNDIITHGYDGFLLDPRNYKEWITLTSNIINNPEISVRVSNCAASSIKTKFNWNSTIDKYQKLYNINYN
jgi:glycosyltransferase involved in cell wall biosynthesis